MLIHEIKFNISGSLKNASLSQAAGYLTQCSAKEEEEELK
jgi:hypothetical protein